MSSRHQQNTVDVVIVGSDQAEPSLAPASARTHPGWWCFLEAGTPTSPMGIRKSSSTRPTSRNRPNSTIAGDVLFEQRPVRRFHRHR
jgi:hypothetical protein